MKALNITVFSLIALFLFPVCAGNSKGYSVINKNLSEEYQKDSHEITSILNDIQNGILKDDLSILLNHVNKQKGVYIDLKAHKTYAELKKQIEDPDSYLNTFFLYSDKLKKTTNDSKQVAIKDILSSQKNIKIELFFNETGDECEARIFLERKKKENYRLNNPYFVKIKDKWYIYRLL